MRFTTVALGATALVTLAAAQPALAGQTLDAIKARGNIVCGVSTGLPGFSNPDDKGSWTGLDVDVCRAVAAALFGDASKVKYTPLTSRERFTALQSGEVDLLSRNTTWTVLRDTQLGFEFTGITYYDGQGFMVPKKLGVKSALELDGASVCVQPGTTTELNLADYFRTNNMKYSPVVFETDDEIRVAFTQGRCDVFTTDQSGLYANRIALPSPDEWVVLPEVISKEPLGPVVRHGDDEWADIVRWSLFAMVGGEEYGVTSKNVDELKAKTTNPEIKRLLGTEGEIGKALKLNADWAYQIIKQVGSYGESFERNVGATTPLKIARGLNNQWTKGGLQYAPPFR
jgi:general L-amino acid transport system substrate-binding protein